MIKIPKLPWLIAGMLFFSTLINYTARLTLSVVVGNVLRDFSMTERDYCPDCQPFPGCLRGDVRGVGICGGPPGNAPRVCAVCVGVVRRPGADRICAGKVVAGGEPIRPGARRARQLSGGSQNRLRVVSSPPARGGGRYLQRRFVAGRGSGRTGGSLPDATLRLEVGVFLYRRSGICLVGLVADRLPGSGFPPLVCCPQG